MPVSSGGFQRRRLTGWRISLPSHISANETFLLCCPCAIEHIPSRFLQFRSRPPTWDGGWSERLLVWANTTGSSFSGAEQASARYPPKQRPRNLLLETTRTWLVSQPRRRESGGSGSGAQ